MIRLKPFAKNFITSNFWPTRKSHTFSFLALLLLLLLYLCFEMCVLKIRTAAEKRRRASLSHHADGIIHTSSHTHEKYTNFRTMRGCLYPDNNICRFVVVPSKASYCSGSVRQRKRNDEKTAKNSVRETETQIKTHSLPHTHASRAHSHTHTHILADIKFNKTNKNSWKMKTSKFTRDMLL